MAKSPNIYTSKTPDHFASWSCLRTVYHPALAHLYSCILEISLALGSLPIKTSCTLIYSSWHSLFTSFILTEGDKIYTFSVEQKPNTCEKNLWYGVKTGLRDVEWSAWAETSYFKIRMALMESWNREWKYVWLFFCISLNYPLFCLLRLHSNYFASPFTITSSTRA